MPRFNAGPTGKYSALPSEHGKRLEADCTHGSVGRLFPLKSRQIAKVSATFNTAAPKISLRVGDVTFQALFDTGAARSLLHESLFRKLPILKEKICSELDVELYDVHNKKLETFGKVRLPILFGTTSLLQEFIVTNGISETCILGADAIFSHGFVVDGQSKRIFFSARRAWPSTLAGDFVTIGEKYVDSSTHYGNVPSHIKRRRSSRKI